MEQTESVTSLVGAAYLCLTETKKPVFDILTDLSKRSYLLGQGHKNLTQFEAESIAENNRVHDEIAALDESKQGEFITEVGEKDGLQNLINDVMKLLDGIDADGGDSEGGWWETSTAAK